MRWFRSFDRSDNGKSNGKTVDDPIVQDEDCGSSQVDSMSCHEKDPWDYPYGEGYPWDSRYDDGDLWDSCDDGFCGDDEHSSDCDDSQHNGCVSVGGDYHPFSDPFSYDDCQCFDYDLYEFERLEDEWMDKWYLIQDALELRQLRKPSLHNNGGWHFFDEKQVSKYRNMISKNGKKRRFYNLKGQNVRRKKVEKEFYFWFHQAQETVPDMMDPDMEFEEDPDAWMDVRHGDVVLPDFLKAKNQSNNVYWEYYQLIDPAWREMHYELLRDGYDEIQADFYRREEAYWEEDYL